MKIYILLIALISTIAFSQESTVPVKKEVKDKAKGGPTYNFHFHNGEQAPEQVKPQKVKPVTPVPVTTAPVVAPKAPESPFEFHNVEIGYYSFADVDNNTDIYPGSLAGPTLTLEDQIAVTTLWRISNKLFLTPALTINYFNGELTREDNSCFWDFGNSGTCFKTDSYVGIIPGVKLGLRYYSNPGRGWGLRAGGDIMYSTGDVKTVDNEGKVDITSVGYNLYAGGQYAFKYVTVGAQFGVASVLTNYKDHAAETFSTKESSGALTVSFAI